MYGENVIGLHEPVIRVDENHLDSSVCNRSSSVLLFLAEKLIFVVKERLSHLEIVFLFLVKLF